MAKEDLIEGLRYALSRGDTLEKAMMTFYNAGYPKEDIEGAAYYLQSPQMPGTFQNPSPVKPVAASSNQPQQPIPNVSPPVQYMQPPQAMQNVSSYGPRPRSSGKAVTIILVFMLVFLLGILITVFLFRDKLSELLSGLL